MPLTYTLDDSILEYLQQINKSIKEKKYWTSFGYNATFESLEVAMGMVQRAYTKLTGTTLEETSRRLFENVQGGGIETFVNYYNAFLFIRKLEYKLRWHQNYGSFPD
jgi:hypothetical protein